MLTFVEAISLAGDRAKQNDDACGFAVRGAGSGWVIDGATDLHNTPLMHAASDASWIAQMADHCLHAWTIGDHRAAIRQASERCATGFNYLLNGRTFEKWQSPIASLLMLSEDATGDIYGIDLGDCRCFALDANGGTHVVGGPGDASDNESKLAAQQTDAHKPLLQRTQTVAVLREQRARLNCEGSHWTFGLNPACADHARTWTLELKRPAHLLLMTDGFAALTDRYDAYGAGDLVQAALTRGLQELGRELRTIEAADAGGAKHPRFKASDDATALLMRLS
jgi:hypothetical protein